MNVTLLIVEDDVRNMRLMRSLLSAHGYILHCAQDGQQGVELAIQHKPDVILMDIQLPVMDGLEATNRIRNHDSTRDVPVIALTAQAMRGDRERILQSGFSDYITKPIHLPELLNAINKWVRQELMP